MKQDLFEWLNSGNAAKFPEPKPEHSENDTPENFGGLLIVPINSREDFPVVEQESEPESKPEIEIEAEVASEPEPEIPERLSIEIQQDPPQELWTQIDDENDNSQDETDFLTGNLLQKSEPESESEAQNSQIEAENPEQNLNYFSLELNENFQIPDLNLNLEEIERNIAELEQQIAQNNAQSQEQEQEHDYEPREAIDLEEQREMSQYQRGTHFTQKLKRVLKKRQDQAEQQRILEHRNAKSSRKRIILNILLGILVLEIVFATLALVYLQTKIPDNILNQASELFETGNYDEAFRLYETGANLYPDIPEFADGLKQAAHMAGNFDENEISEDIPEPEPEPEPELEILSDDLELEEFELELESEIASQDFADFSQDIMIQENAIKFSNE